MGACGWRSHTPLQPKAIKQGIMLYLAVPLETYDIAFACIGSLSPALRAAALTPQLLSHQRERGARKIFYTTDASGHDMISSPVVSFIASCSPSPIKGEGALGVRVEVRCAKIIAQINIEPQSPTKKSRRASSSSRY